LSNEQLGAFFRQAEIRIQGNRSLRVPQAEGHAAAVDFFANGGYRGIERIPVGCGKSGLITLLPFGIADGRVLVIAPNLTIRNQLAADLNFTDMDSFYRRTGALLDLHDGPYRAVLDSDANLGDTRDAHIVVTNIHQLAQRVDRWLPNFEPNFFDLILVDEGHHNAAPTWQLVFDRFPAAEVVSLTATPFRADEQPVEGEVIYTFTFRRGDAERLHQGYHRLERGAERDLLHISRRRVPPHARRGTRHAGGELVLTGSCASPRVQRFDRRRLNPMAQPPP
jgi:DNA repair protein RadD